jgi:hypothetical protein
LRLGVEARPLRVAADGLREAQKTARLPRGAADVQPDEKVDFREQARSNNGAVE